MKPIADHDFQPLTAFSFSRVTKEGYTLRTRENPAVSYNGCVDDGIVPTGRILPANWHNPVMGSLGRLNLPSLVLNLPLGQLA